MKSLLKCLAFGFLVLLTIWLSACKGGNDGPAPTPTPPPTPTPTPLPANASLPQRVRARGYLVVGIRYDLPPFGYVTDGGELAGFDVDLARELALRWLDNPDAVRFRQVRSDTAAEHILAGDVDLTLTALLHTQQAEEQVDFGSPIFEDGEALLVRASDTPTITTPANLAGYPVGIVDGAAAEESLRATVQFTPTIVTYSYFDQATAALARGDVDAVADLRRRLVWGLRQTPGTAIVGQYSSAVAAPAYPPDEPGWADLVTLTFQRMFVDGSFAQLYERWFPGDPPPEVELWPGVARVSLDTAENTARSSGTIAAIQGRGRLLVAMVSDRYPFAYLDAAGAPAGYEVQLVRMLADRWLGDRTAVDFVPVSLDEGMRMVASGGADVLIGAVPHTQEAELEADFSLTTYVAGEGLLVRVGATLGGVAGLDGQTVAVVSGTGSADAVQQAARAAGISVVVVPQATLEDAITVLGTGEVIAVVGERATLLGLDYADPNVGMTADRLTRAPLALVLPPGDSAFGNLVNLTLQATNWDGEFAAAYGSWFDDDPPQFPPWPGAPTQPLLIANR